MLSFFQIQIQESFDIFRVGSHYKPFWGKEYVKKRDNMERTGVSSPLSRIFSPPSCVFLGSIFFLSFRPNTSFSHQSTTPSRFLGDRTSAHHLPSATSRSGDRRFRSIDSVAFRRNQPHGASSLQFDTLTPKMVERAIAGPKEPINGGRLKQQTERTRR